MTAIGIDLAPPSVGELSGINTNGAVAGQTLIFDSNLSLIPGDAAGHTAVTVSNASNAAVSLSVSSNQVMSASLAQSNISHTNLYGINSNSNEQHMTGAQISALHAAVTVSNTAGAALTLSVSSNQVMSVDYNLSLVSHGPIVLPTLTTSTNGTISLAADGVINFYTDSNGTNKIVRISCTNTLTDVAINDGATTFVYANYNSGVPTYGVTEVSATFLTDATLAPLYRITREGSNFYVLNYDYYGAALSEKALYKNVVLYGVQRQSGLELSTSGTLAVTVAEGVSWFGVTKNSNASNISGVAGTLYEYHLTSNAWSRSAVTNYDSQYYSDGSNQQTLDTNKFVSKYFYRCSCSDHNEVYYVSGNQYNKEIDAYNETVQEAPITITPHSIYVGKIVVQQGATVGIAYPRIWESAVVGSSAIAHNDTTGLQGGTTNQYYHLTLAEHDYVLNLPLLNKDPTGFKDAVNVGEAYDITNGTITVSTTNGLYFKGQAVTSMTNGWVSEAHPTNTGSYFLEYNGTNYTWNTNGPSDFALAQVAFVHADGSNSFGMKECHGFIPWEAHRVLHNFVGSGKYGTGGTMSNVVLTSTTAGERRPHVSSLVVLDEDLPVTIPELTTNSYTTIYLTGTVSGSNVGTINWTQGDTDIVRLNGNIPYYNVLTSGTATETPMPANRFMSVWLIAVPVTSDAQSQKFRFLWLQGQSITTSLSLEQAVTTKSLDTRRLKQVAPEFIFIGRAIIRYAGGNWDIQYIEELSGSQYNQVATPGSGGISAVNSDSNVFSGLGTAVSELTLNSNFATVSTNNAITFADVDATHAISSTNASTTTTNGALVIAGGLGVGGTVSATGLNLGNETLSYYDEGTYPVTVTCESGTLNVYDCAGYYTRIGRQVSVQIVLTITSNSNGTGGLFFTVPSGLTPAQNIAGCGREQSATGYALAVTARTTPRIEAYKYDNTTIIADSRLVLVNVTYFV